MSAATYCCNVSNTAGRPAQTGGRHLLMNFLTSSISCTFIFLNYKPQQSYDAQSYAGSSRTWLQQAGQPSVVTIDNYITYSLHFLRPIKTAEAFEAVDWQRTWPQAGSW